VSSAHVKKKNTKLKTNKTTTNNNKYNFPYWFTLGKEAIRVTSMRTSKQLRKNYEN